MPSLCAFIDYQNTYNGAREAFHHYVDPLTEGQIDPLRFAEILAEKDNFDPEVAQVRVYRGRPDSLKDPKGYGANLRQCAAWEQLSPKVKVVWRTLRYPANWPEERRRRRASMSRLRSMLW